MNALCRLCLLLTLSLALVGCVKFKQVWTVNPDGSGKMTQTIGFSELALQQAPEDPFANLDNPEEMIDLENSGWIAFTRPQVIEKDGYKYASFTGYFENINEVTFSGDGGNGDMQATSYELKDGNFTIDNGMLSQVIATISEDPEMQSPANKNIMRQMMAGMEFDETYKLPGEVTDAHGYVKKGQTAQTVVTIEELLDNTGEKIDALKKQQQSITFAPAGWEGQEAAWKAELTQAKTEWATMKNDAPVGAGAE